MMCCRIRNTGNGKSSHPVSTSPAIAPVSGREAVVREAGGSDVRPLPRKEKEVLWSARPLTAVAGATRAGEGCAQEGSQECSRALGIIFDALVSETMQTGIISYRDVRIMADAALKVGWSYDGIAAALISSCCRIAPSCDAPEPTEVVTFYNCRIRTARWFDRQGVCRGTRKRRESAAEAGPETVPGIRPEDLPEIRAEVRVGAIADHGFLQTPEGARKRRGKGLEKGPGKGLGPLIRTAAASAGTDPEYIDIDAPGPDAMDYGQRRYETAVLIADLALCHLVQREEERAGKGISQTKGSA